MFNIKVFPDFSIQNSDDERGQEICQKLAEIKRSIGATYVNVSFFDNKSETVEAVHFLTYPVSWISRYVTRFYSNIDPLFRIDFRTASFIDWADLYLTNEQVELFDSFVDHGLGRNGITCVHHVERDLYCVLSAAFDVAPKDWPERKVELLEIMRFHADHIGETYNRLYLLSMQIEYKITPRESECLYWVAMGKTDDQISSILNVGKWTVNGHLQSAKHKLGSPSRSAAVARAIIMGIIKIRRVV